MENTSNQSQTLNKKLTCFLVILFLIIILTQTYAAPVPKSETVLIPGELNDSEENAQYFNMQYEYTFGNNSPQGNLIIGSQKNSMAKSTSAITPVISYRKTYLQKAGLLIATISSEDGSEYSLEITNSCSQNLCNLKTLSTTQKYCIINAIPDYYYFKITRLSGDGNHFLDADFEEGTNDSSPTAKTCSKPIITDFSPNQEITVIQNANQEFKITASDKENSNISINWLVDDQPEGTGQKYYFKTNQLGIHKIRATTKNSEFETAIDWNVIVIEPPNWCDDTNLELIAQNCPQEVLDENFSFTWCIGKYTKSTSLDISSDANFKNKTSINITNFDSYQIKTQYSTLIALENKSTAKKLYSRILGIDKSGKTAYSNSCEFQLTRPVPPTLTCPEQPIDENYSFERNANDYKKTSNLELSSDKNFKTKISIETNTKNPTLIKTQYQTLITYEKSSVDKTAYARITATDKYNRKTTSNICEFKLKQPTLPSLSCPQQKIDSNYQFYWTSGDYTKTSSLEVDYNESFKQKITILSTKTNPFVIKNYYQILLTLSSKTSGGNLIARIYSTDNYGRSAYSNMCIFKAKKPSVCSKNSDCGIDKVVGVKFCKGIEIYQKYKIFTCNNPGQEEAFCTNSENESLLQECNACTNGACTPNPVLSCPTAPVNYDYSFEWGKGETKARWLQIGYDNKFSGLTYKELDTYESSKQIANDFKSIIEYSKKSTTKKLYARIRATSNQNRQIYSNTCEFTLKQPIVPALTCPTSPVTQSSTFLFSPNDYTNNSLELSFNNSFATTRIETASNNIVQAADLRDDIDLFKRYYNSSIKNNTFYARIYGKEAYFGIAYSNICTFIIQNGTLKEQTTTPLTLELSSLTANQSEGLATIIKTSATTQNNNAIHFLSYPDINQILNQTINTNTTSKRISAKTLDTNAKTDSGETVQQTLIEEQNQSGQIEQGILYTITTDINNHPEANNTARTDAKSTSTCELKYTDSGQCDSKWQFYQISFTSSTISEARYRFVDCTTGNILGKGQICSGEQSPKHYRPEGHSVKFEMDYYTCPNNKCKIETPNLCTGVTCTNYCWTGNRYYNGTCTQGVCNYSNQNCPNNSCTNGSCIANNCPNGCAAYCGGNTLFYTGYCSNSTCIYNTSTTCQNGCTNGACNSQTCATGWKCKDTITKAYQNSDCTWSTETNCPSGCNNGACIQTTCSAGWRCYDPYSKGYQNNNCTWNSITSCQNGCNNASCLAGKTPGDNDYCTTSKPCQAGEGNCHNGNECQTGLYCMEAEGARYGYSPPTNVCEEREGAGEWKCQTQNQLGFQLYETKEWTDTINCNNGCENGTCKGSILKDTDSDNDGYSDEDEQLARSNPNDPNSTPFTELRKYSDTINIAEKMTVLELITNILEPGIMQKANFEACKKSKEETNNTALHFSAQNQCKASLSAYKPLAIYMGYCIGAASGVYGSVKDFFTFFIDAFWYLASISNNISILSTDLKNFRDSLSDITNNINAQTAIIVWDSIYKQKYQEGALLSANNQFITDYDDHAGFAHAYANGYISWYISAMVAGGKGASSAIKSVKTGATATKTVETAETIFQNYPRLAKATQTGGKISEAVNTLAKKYPLQWVDDVYGKVGDGVGEVKNIWKGKNFSWADETFYNHTFVEIRINETTTRAQQIMQAFPKSFKKNEDIINAIGKTIEDGERNNVGNIVKAFPSKNSESRYLEIRVGNNGRINTIIPGDKIA